LDFYSASLLKVAGQIDPRSNHCIIMSFYLI
jgi:hypothetical protein